jgi:hypothetical protein
VTRADAQRLVAMILDSARARQLITHDHPDHFLDEATEPSRTRELSHTRPSSPTSGARCRSR